MTKVDERACKYYLTVISKGTLTIFMHRFKIINSLTLAFTAITISLASLEDVVAEKKDTDQGTERRGDLLYCSKSGGERLIDLA